MESKNMESVKNNDGDKKEEPVVEKETPKIQFWSENPNILLDPKYIFELFPTSEMEYGQKMNAVSRLVIMITLVMFVILKSLRVVLVGILTLGSIYLVYLYTIKDMKKEGYENPMLISLAEQGLQIPSHVFDKPSSSNPFSNVLIPDYHYNPNKKPAPPAFNENINDQILNQAKLFVQEANPDQPDIADKLFKDLGDQYIFEQSMRPFYSTPNTMIPNDQQAFTDFCYGSMISCKEGNQFACARNMSRHINP
jgi:hypothetical protein